MTEVVSTKSQEEYEDDFEKDLDWLIGEEGQSEDQGPDYEDIEAEIDKELGEDEGRKERMKQKEKRNKEEKRSDRTEELDEEEERWPSPMEPLEYDSDRESPSKSSPVVLPPPGMDDQTEEEKKYIQEKIQQANRELRDQAAPDLTRRRRLHFKEKLVDLVVPPLQFEKDQSGEGQGKKDGKQGAQDAEEVSGKLSELQISPREEGQSRCCGVGGSGDGGLREPKESRVLVERDGKFDLVSLKEVESQGLLLPPIANSCSSPEQATGRSKGHASSSSPRSRTGSSTSQQGIHPPRAPRPPPQPRGRPSSASHSQRGGQRRGTKRRVQSATGTPCQGTYTLSPQQKELLHKIQERKESLSREAEQRKLEEEKQKKQENDLAFKAWLMKKREQLQGERRIHRAQEMERMNSKKDSSDPEEAFRLWLQKKQEQQQKERQLVELKKLEEDGGYLLHSREECEHAFKLWLKRKREEKRAEQRAARESSRRLVLEERRARRTRDLLCAANEAKSFRFSEQLMYHY